MGDSGQTAPFYDVMNRRCADWVLVDERALAERPAGARRPPGNDLDRAVQGAGALQLAPAVLLRAEGVTLSWVGTGRCLCSMDFTAERLRRRCSAALLNAAHDMKRDGWWLDGERTPGKEKRMKARLCRRCLAAWCTCRRPSRRSTGR